MLGGIQMQLYLGPGVPIPATRELIDALTGVEVSTDSLSGKTGATLSFEVSNRSAIHTLFLVSAGAVIPMFRVAVVVTVRGTEHVLMDGVVTDQQVSPGRGGKSTITVIAEDLSRVMDYIDFSGVPYPAMPRELRVAAILSKYAVVGIVPAVIPSVAIDIPLPTRRIHSQRGRDLTYVRTLAEEVGYVFYVEPGPKLGMSIGYWGPEVKAAPPQRALNLDMDAHTNVESLSFSYRTDPRKLPLVTLHDEMVKAPIPIPIPDINPLSPPLGVIAPLPTALDPVPGTAKMSPAQALMVGIAKASRGAEVVSGTGSLDVLRYGDVLKARGLVGVRGAGPAFDGLYYVRSVKHKLKRGEYKQDFTLVRNGVLSTVPRVPA